MRVRKTDLSIGSYVYITDGSVRITCEVKELLEKTATLMVVRVPEPCNSGVRYGDVVRVKYNDIYHITIESDILRRLGFIDADGDKGWELVYYFGDMKLLARWNKKKNYPSFRFKSDFTKSYTKIECRHVADLQSIMRFLTGGELIFMYVSS